MRMRPLLPAKLYHHSTRERSKWRKYKQYKSTHKHSNPLKARKLVLSNSKEHRKSNNSRNSKILFKSNHQPFLNSKAKSVITASNPRK